MTATPRDPLHAVNAVALPDGGPAFPVSIPGCGDNGQHGMSLRDYFAAQSISAVIQICAPDGREGMSHEEYFAKCAYDVADAMLAERAKAEER